MKGRGTEAPRRKGRQERSLPELHFDYCFMGGEPKKAEDGPAEALTILVVREIKTKMVMATVVPTKTSGRYVAARVLAVSYTHLTLPTTPYV